MKKSVEEIVEYIEDELENEKRTCINARDHLWTAAAAKMDLCQELLEFIDEDYLPDTERF